MTRNRAILPSWVLVCLFAAGCGSSQNAPPVSYDAAVGQDAKAGFCGDYVCNNGENCKTCPRDCGGGCSPCNYSPICEGAEGIPANPAPRPDLCIGKPSTTGSPASSGMGPMNCEAPQLRLRVQKLRANGSGGAAYCIIAASDGTHSELAFTPKSSNLKAGAEYAYDPSVGMFWGQILMAGLQSSPADITIQYKCFLVQSDALARALQAAGAAAMGAAGNQGQYGWAFGLGGAAADALGAALMAASGDKLQLDATQTIKKSDLLDLTNGRYFTVQNASNGGDWTLFVQAWGCAEGTP